MTRKKSSVAGIIDTNGGLRIVVTPRWRMKYHVAPGEKLFIIPNYKLREPIPFEDISGMIEKVKSYINEQTQ